MSDDIKNTSESPVAKEFGLVAMFDSPASLLNAAKKVKEQGYKKFDTYSPFPIHGMDRASGIKPSCLGWIVLVIGTVGLVGGFLLQTWVHSKAYPLVISGKPLFAFQAYVPVTFELMVLFSAFAAVFGMFMLNKLPMWHHPLNNSELYETASSHGFLLCIEKDDQKYETQATKSFLKSLGAVEIEVVMA